jgi:hypothetical protein
MSEKPVASIKTLARYEPDTVYIGTGEYVAECVRADDGDYYLAADVDAAIEALRAEVAEWKRVAAARAELHDKAEARAERLAEALRELGEREQRDEVLLLQALEALGRAHQTAMEQTLKARVPECAEFAGIAQDLDFVVAALRERLGEGAEP